MIEKINQKREYLDYYKEHYNNIKKAWELIKEKCSDMSFIRNKNIIKIVDNEIKYHDVSKISAEENFIAYRQYFYPCSWGQKNEEQYLEAKDHHWKYCNYHWKKWRGKYKSIDELIPHLLTMTADWVAIGFKFGTSANKYFKDNLENITSPEWVVITINKIFDRIYK